MTESWKLFVFFGGAATRRLRRRQLALPAAHALREITRSVTADSYAPEGRTRPSAEEKRVRPKGRTKKTIATAPLWQSSTNVIMTRLTKELEKKLEEIYQTVQQFSLASTDSSKEQNIWRYHLSLGQ